MVCVRFKQKERRRKRYGRAINSLTPVTMKNRPR
jgi:hypothetical protein